jgi:hypothetical protein
VGKQSKSELILLAGHRTVLEIFSQPEIWKETFRRLEQSGKLRESFEKKAAGWLEAIAGKMQALGARNKFADFIFWGVERRWVFAKG